ncbi:hypothetical protein B0H66DRAFT_195933 [Apodospora peruviana]|uniref:Mitochondrial cytochrome c oxidase assembly factor n=1 Tax=Apodospora peruviana TaxID=516989 RepID=A0AAE0M8A3_9PEZI|nr:hypothetical protein B0H66DRAFT_195933 [Apodospora peruviana]
MGGLNLEVVKVNFAPLFPCRRGASPPLPFPRPLTGLTIFGTAKFGMYLMFPIGIMYYFGTNLDSRFSVPDFWPKPEQTNKVPTDRDEINAELERLRAKRLYLRDRRLAAEAQAQARQQQAQAQAQQADDSRQ